MKQVDVYHKREDLASNYDAFVFEGAQGLLLDRDLGIHATPSHPGLRNLVDWFTKDFDVEVCYVSRTYFTRHGRGPFPTECRKEDINAAMVDLTNVPNEFQETLRYGFFDFEAFRGALDRELPYASAIAGRAASFKQHIALTHLNETDECVMVDHGTRIPVCAFQMAVPYPVTYVSRDELVIEKM